MCRFKGNEDDEDVRMAATGFIFLLQKYQKKKQRALLHETSIV
jgi:hypothetical protein